VLANGRYIVGGQRGGLPTYLFQDFTRKGRGYLPIILEKKSYLNFLENFTRKGGWGYLPIISRILLEKVGVPTISNLFEVGLYRGLSK